MRIINIFMRMRRHIENIVSETDTIEEFKSGNCEKAYNLCRQYFDSTPRYKSKKSIVFNFVNAMTYGGLETDGLDIYDARKKLNLLKKSKKQLKKNNPRHSHDIGMGDYIDSEISRLMKVFHNAYYSKRKIKRVVRKRHGIPFYKNVYPTIEDAENYIKKTRARKMKKENEIAEEERLKDIFKPRYSDWDGSLDCSKIVEWRDRTYHFEPIQPQPIQQPAPQQPNYDVIMFHQQHLSNLLKGLDKAVTSLERTFQRKQIESLKYKIRKLENQKPPKIIISNVGNMPIKDSTAVRPQNSVRIGITGEVSNVELNNVGNMPIENSSVSRPTNHLNWEDYPNIPL